MPTTNRHARRRAETLQRHGSIEAEIALSTDRLAAPLMPASLPVGRVFQDFAGISRSQQYRLIAERELRSFLVGNRRYIEIRSWHELMARRLAADDQLRASGGRMRIAGCTSRWNSQPYAG